MSAHPLTSTLSRLQQRTLAVGGTAGFLWMLAAAVVWLLIGVWLDLLLDLSPEWRIGILASSGIAAIVVFLRLFQLSKAGGQWQVLARRLDDAARSGGQILCGFELLTANSQRFASPQSELTAGLSTLAVGRAANLAGGVPAASVISAGPMRRSGIALGALILLVAGACWLMPRLTATEWSRFSDPYGDHPPVTNTMFEVTPGDAQVVYGQGIEIRVEVVGTPVKDVELVMRPLADDGSQAAEEQVVPMFGEASGQFRAALTNLVAPTEYIVRARNSRSRKYRIEVITVPRIEGVGFRITPPAYTRLSPTEGPLPAGGLAGLPGTKILATAKSNRPLSGGRLAYVTQAGRDETPLTAAAGTPESVSGEFVVTAAGRIEIQVTDVAGQNSQEPFSAAITVLVDERPFIRLIEPRAVSLASPTAVVPVVVSAEDDYGISRLQLFRSLNDSTYLPMDLPLAGAPTRMAYQVIPLLLADFQLEPGDEIKVFARVEDNDPRAAIGESATGAIGKGTESSVAVIRIISQEDFDRLRQTREGMDSLLSKYQQVRRRLESVADDLDQLEHKFGDAAKDQKPDDEQRRELRQLAENIRQEAETLRKLAEQQHFPLDEELAAELRRQADALERLMKEIQKLADDPDALNEKIQEELQRLEDQLRGERERLDQDVMEPLETMAKVFPLKQDEARFVQLYQRQRDLADRLQSLRRYEAADDPAMKARMRDLEMEQRRIRTDLDDLLTDIEEHVAKLPEEDDFQELRESATKFAKAVRESGADKAMQEAEAGLADFSGRRGYDGAKEAADILEKFLSQNQEMGGQASGAMGRFQPGLAGSMEQTMQQLLQNMGLGQQPGMGEGNGGGYSSRQNTMDNVGLYGNTPSMDESQQQGMGARSQSARAGRGTANGQESNRQTETGMNLENPLRSTGASDAATPLRYRRQVGRYFQRLADELGEP